MFKQNKEDLFLTPLTDLLLRVTKVNNYMYLTIEQCNIAC